MVAQIAGCSITAEAWRPASRLAGAQVDLSNTFHFLYEEVESYLEDSMNKSRKSVFSTQLRESKPLPRKGAFSDARITFPRC